MTNEERAPLRAALTEAIEMLEHASEDVRGFGLKRIRGMVDALKDVRKRGGKTEAAPLTDAEQAEEATRRG